MQFRRAAPNGAGWRTDSGPIRLAVRRRNKRVAAGLCVAGPAPLHDPPRSTKPTTITTDPHFSDLSSQKLSSPNEQSLWRTARPVTPTTAGRATPRPPT